MAARNRNEAHNNFARYFRESLSVVTKATLSLRIVGDERALFYEPPVKLRRSTGDDLYLAITQTYLISDVAEGGFKAKTTSYSYELMVKRDQTYQAIAEFHWHPNSPGNIPFPHVHVKANSPDGALDRKHFPTARLSVEDFLRFLMRDFDVKSGLPRAEWREILTRNKREFVGSASWLNWEPLI